MFSRDNRHYRATPRSIQQAFGPHTDSFISDSDRREFNRRRWIDIASMAACTLGSIACAIAIGVMLGWQG